MRVKMEAEILLPLPRKQAASPSASWAPCPFVLLLRANPRGSPKPSFPSPSLSPHIPAISSTCGPSPSPRQAGTSVLFPLPAHSPRHLSPGTTRQPLPKASFPFSPSSCLSKPIPSSSDQTRSLPSASPSRGSSSPSELNADSLPGSQLRMSSSLGHPVSLHYSSLRFSLLLGLPN